MIEVEHLRKEYGDKVVLRDVTLTIARGEVVAVIGPSGTGKSTLVRCLNLLERPSAGRILIDGQDILDGGCDVAAIRRKLGMVFQSFNLFSHLTVIENLMIAPCDLLGLSRTEAYERGMGLLREVGLPDKALAYPVELSGGQRQRVAIARTLAMEPEAVLLDEPTSALDPTMVGEVKAVIRRLAESGRTLVIVTHEMEFARSIASRVIYLDEGVVYEQGTPEEVFEHPRRERTRWFVRHLKVLECTLAGRDADVPGVFGEIEAYCLRNQIVRRVQMRIELAFDELCANMLLARLDDPRVEMVVEYDERAGEATMVVRHNGEPDLLESGDDDLSLAVLRSVVTDMYAEAIDEPPYLGRVTLRLRSAWDRGPAGAGEGTVRL